MDSLWRFLLALVFVVADCHASEAISVVSQLTDKSETNIIGNLNDADTLYLVFSQPTSTVEKWQKSLMAMHPDHDVIGIIANERKTSGCGYAIISLGVEAVNSAIAQHPLCSHYAVYIPKEHFDKLVTTNPEINLQAIYLDPPLYRQAILGSLIQPQSRQISILTHAKSKELAVTLAQIEIALPKQKIIIDSLDSHHSMATLLTHTSRDSDYVVGILDSTIYNTKNIKHILLTLYRHDRFLIGPTSAFVQAGAIASTYSTQTQLAQQVSELVNKPAKGTAGHYAKYFSVATNKQVARSLNRVLPEDQDLELSIRTWEQENIHKIDFVNLPAKTDADHNPAGAYIPPYRTKSDN